jgi:hypothetical protein
MEDKDTELLKEHKGTGESKCCGAGTYGEYEICETCGEHC